MNDVLCAMTYDAMCSMRGNNVLPDLKYVVCVKIFTEIFYETSCRGQCWDLA